MTQEELDDLSTIEFGITIMFRFDSTVSYLDNIKILKKNDKKRRLLYTELKTG